MKFAEGLTIARKNNLNILAVTVADEVSKLTVSNFEEVCSYIYSCFIENNEFSVRILVKAFEKLLNDGYTENEIIQKRYYAFRDEARYV